jgi:hypothetical protein
MHCIEYWCIKYNHVCAHSHLPSHTTPYTTRKHTHAFEHAPNQTHIHSNTHTLKHTHTHTDPVPNVRRKFVECCPLIKRLVVLPRDQKWHSQWCKYVQVLEQDPDRSVCVCVCVCVCVSTRVRVCACTLHV